MNFSTRILLITTALLLGACDSNSPTGVTDPVEQPPTEFAMLQALNASPDGPNINVIVGATAISSDIDFMGGTAEGSGPPGSQPISIEAVIPGVDDDGDPLTEPLIAEPPIALFVDTVTTVVVTGLDGAQTLSVFVQDKTDDDGVFEEVSAGAARVFVVHADPGVGSVDVYIVAPNAVLDAPLAEAIDFEGSGVPTEFAAGAYELVITLTGFPDAVIFNQFISLLDGADLTMAIVADAIAIDAIQVVSMDGTGATTIYDIITPALLTIDHLSADAGTVDAVSDVPVDPTTLAADMIYLDRAGDAFVAGAHEVSFVADGLGTLASVDVAGARGSYDAVVLDGFLVTVGGLNELAATVLKCNNPGAEDGRFGDTGCTDNPRPVSSYAKARLYFGSPSIGSVDVYAVAPMTDITDLDPDVEAGAFRDNTGYAPANAGDFEIIVTEVAEEDEPKIVIFSQLVTVENGVVYTLILADPAAGDTEFLLLVREDDIFGGP